MVAYALVDALVVACQDDEVALHRQFVGHVLVEAFAVGRCEDDLVVVALLLQCRDAAVNGLALHDHACRTAVGIVVDAAPLVERVVTEVVEADFCQSFLFGPCQDGLVDEAFQHLGQYGDDVYSHVFSLVGLLPIYVEGLGPGLSYFRLQSYKKYLVLPNTP